MTAAVIVIRQNRYMERFAQAGALDAAHATTLEAVACRDSWVFQRMVRQGVFVCCGDGRFYMDTPASEAFLQRRKRPDRARRLQELTSKVTQMQKLVTVYLDNDAYMGGKWVRGSYADKHCFRSISRTIWPTAGGLNRFTVSVGPTPASTSAAGLWRYWKSRRGV